MYYIKCGTDYICKGSYIVNGEKYKIVGTIEEAQKKAEKMAGE